jgi:hypothetical protein
MLIKIRVSCIARNLYEELHQSLCLIWTKIVISQQQQYNHRTANSVTIYFSDVFEFLKAETDRHGNFKKPITTNNIFLRAHANNMKHSCLDGR